MSNDNPIAPPTFYSPISASILPTRSNTLAFAEGALILGGFAILNYSGVLPFGSLPVHPFLFVVILLSAQYGIQGGILAALGAIALFHIDGWPARPIEMSYADYFRMAWADPLAWVLAALTVGIVTSHRGRTLQELTVKLTKATTAERLIADQYQLLAKRTHQLERSLAGRADGPVANVTPLVSVTSPVMVLAEPGGKTAPRSRAAGKGRRWSADDRA